MDPRRVNGAAQTLVGRIEVRRAAKGRKRIGCDGRKGLLEIHQTPNCSRSNGIQLPLVSARTHVRFAFGSKRVTTIGMALRCFLFHRKGYFTSGEHTIVWVDDRSDTYAQIILSMKLPDGELDHSAERPGATISMPTLRALMEDGVAFEIG